MLLHCKGWRSRWHKILQYQILAKDMMSRRPGHRLDKRFCTFGGSAAAEVCSVSSTNSDSVLIAANPGSHNDISDDDVEPQSEVQPVESRNRFVPSPISTDEIRVLHIAPATTYERPICDEPLVCWLRRIKLPRHTVDDDPHSWIRHAGSILHSIVRLGSISSGRLAPCRDHHLRWGLTSKDYRPALCFEACACTAGRQKDHRHTADLD